jgi:Domain of unknown function (DUF4136)
MKLANLILTLGLIVLLSSCSSLNISTDYDPTQDFSKYKTYRWARIKERDPNDILSKNINLRKKVQVAVNKVLKERGFTKLDRGKPDFIVFILAGVQQRINVYNYGGYYYGGWGGPYGGYTSMSRYKQGTLIVDIVDTEEMELSWRGIASDVVRSYSDPEELQEELDYVISSMLEDFPPN